MDEDTCSACGATFPAQQLNPGGDGLICLGCEFDETQPKVTVFGPFMMASTLAVLLPFFGHYGPSWSPLFGRYLTVTSFEIGHVSYLSKDWVGVGGGAVGLLAGLLMLKQAVAVPEVRMKASIIGLGLILMGAYQLHYGLGL